MDSSFQIPTTIAQLRAKATQPYEVGQACGEFLSAIHALVSYHLGHPSTYKSKPPAATISTQELAAVVDAQLLHLRSADGVSDAFPDDLLVDRKQRRPRRKYLRKYTSVLRSSLKDQIEIHLRDVFLGWDTENTQRFNKGLDYGLTRMAWRVYPSANAVLEAKGEDWSEWLRTRCEELEKLSVKQGKGVFDV